MQFTAKVFLTFRLLALAALLVFSAQASEASDSAAAKKTGAVKKGDKVTVEYTLTLADGKVVDSSKDHDKPLKFEVGSGQIITGFDNAVIGMKKGDEKQFTLKPADAYGEQDPKLVQKVPRKDLPQDQEPKVGMGLVVGSPDGRQMRAMITEVTAQSVTLDLNHPLAGKALTFKIKLVDISS